MNTILNKYIIIKFLKIFLNVLLIFIALAIILTLFEEIEFFKKLNVSNGLPFFLTLLYIPSLSINLLPFIIFISAMWYFVSIKLKPDLISFKIFGYSNLRIVLILSVTAFLIGLLILFTLNPITSNMIKYYEEIKSRHSRDTDHLFSITKNGLWIKEISGSKSNIISAGYLKNNYLSEVSIFQMDGENLVSRIEASKADISKKNWLLSEVKIFRFDEEISVEEINELKFFSIYDIEKINGLYKNLDTISFISLITQYKQLNRQGYSDKVLFQKLNTFITLPIYLFFMVMLASIFTLSSIKKSQNFYYIFISILSCVVIYYFKDLSIALGETNKISSILSIWMPVVLISLFCLIGMIQINEK